MSVSRTAFASPPDRIPLFEEAVRIEPSTVQYVRTHVSPVCMPSQSSYSSRLPLLTTCNLHTQVLTIGNLGPETSVDMALTPCGDYTYFCCGQDDAARTCCTLGNGTVLLAAGTAILPTASHIHRYNHRHWLTYHLPLHRHCCNSRIERLPVNEPYRTNCCWTWGCVRCCSDYCGGVCCDVEAEVKPADSFGARGGNIPLHWSVKWYQ